MFFLSDPGVFDVTINLLGQMQDEFSGQQFSVLRVLWFHEQAVFLNEIDTFDQNVIKEQFRGKYFIIHHKVVIERVHLHCTQANSD